MTQTDTATPTIDPLAGLPDDMRAVVSEFWANLRPTGKQAPCPRCKALTEMRTARGGRFRWGYVLHCGEIRQLTPTW